MAFQIKSFTSIVASMINFVRGTSEKVTDFNVGSVARTLIEAPAIEIDELYQQMFNGLNEAIPVSLYTTLGFDALPAMQASGVVRITYTSSASAVLLPAGTKFTVQSWPVVYASTADISLAAGSTFADIYVVADTAGVIGNLSAGTAFAIAPQFTGFLTASNLVAITNGIDAETEGARKIRFINFINSLSRGTNSAVQYGLGTVALLDANGNQIERVASSALIEPWLADITLPVGLVKAYVHNGVGGTSSALLTQARKVIYGYYDDLNRPVPGWKSAGVQIDIYAATETIVNVSCVITANSGVDKATLLTLCQSAIYAYIQALPIGSSCLYAEVVAMVMSVPGVYNVVVSTPTADVVAAATVKLMPGAITVT